jgi:hypothetical protein
MSISSSVRLAVSVEISRYVNNRKLKIHQLEAVTRTWIECPYDRNGDEVDQAEEEECIVIPSSKKRRSDFGN